MLHAAAVLMMHDMRCRNDMDLCLASSRNMTASEAYCRQALAKHAGQLFLVNFLRSMGKYFSASISWLGQPFPEMAVPWNNCLGLLAS